MRDVRNAMKRLNWDRKRSEELEELTEQACSQDKPSVSASHLLTEAVGCSFRSRRIVAGRADLLSPQQDPVLHLLRTTPRSFYTAQLL